jgi:hypothetical protein
MISAILFAWISTRAEQAATEGLDRIEAACRTAPPQNGINAWDAGAVAVILPLLAKEDGIDWEQPLRTWSKDQMIKFLLRAVSLVSTAMEAREHAR